jgi:hypothetical protein
VPENLDGVSGFDPPPSPPARCVKWEMWYCPMAGRAGWPKEACLRGETKPCCCAHSYNNPHPATEDYAKEPPAMPPHLQLTLLNVPPALDAQAVLPRPQHVILNHTYCQRGQVCPLTTHTTTHTPVFVIPALHTKCDILQRALCHIPMHAVSCDPHPLLCPRAVTHTPHMPKHAHANATTPSKEPG